MMKLGVPLVLFALITLCRPAGAESSPIERTDYSVQSEPGISLFVRELRLKDREGLPPILLLHGARVPGVASFDLPVPGGSLATDLARAGHAVYIMDARGYGGSTRPPEMSRPPEGHSPLVRSSEVVRDVAAVVEWIGEHAGGRRVALLGWATGGHWLGYYAALYPEQVSHLVLYNTLYGGAGPHPTLGPGSGLEDPERPGRFDEQAFGAYRFNTAESLFPSWNRSIPEKDKSLWRDPDVAQAYAAAALESDPTARERTPASFRAPTGALEDSYYLAVGRQLWDASLIRAPTLIIRSGNDFWSQPEDARSLQEHLVHAPETRLVVLPDATHYVHLDRPERGRDQFVREVLEFIGGE